MSSNQLLKNIDLKLLFVVIGWIILSGLLFTGQLEIYTEGNIENSIIISFAIVVLVLHLFSILKGLANNKFV